MKLFVDRKAEASPCELVFHEDGSFGQGRPDFALDYEIGLSRFGHLALVGDSRNGICYSLEGFSWKEFSKTQIGHIEAEVKGECRLHFALEAGDMTEWGSKYSEGFELLLADPINGLVLFGSLPLGAEVLRFARGQYVCLVLDEIVGFIIKCPVSFFAKGIGHLPLSI